MWHGLVGVSVMTTAGRLGHASAKVWFLADTFFFFGGARGIDNFNRRLINLGCDATRLEIELSELSDNLSIEEKKT